MSKKDCVFDDVDGALEMDVPAGTEARHGPMVAEIVENAEALSERQSAETAIRAKNDALAHEHLRLKRAGLIIDLIALDDIRTDKLTRDRAPGRDPEIDALKRSIKEVGLSNPIRVEQVGDDYELIQGFRRVIAYRELFAETGDAAYASIPAGINAKGENLLHLYRQMVDENLVRRGVSFGEMAQLAINYRKQAAEVAGYEHAVELLFASSGRQKRSYIKHFVRLLVAAKGRIKHVDTIPRALGLAVVRRLEESPVAQGILNDMLGAGDDRTAAQEQTLMGAFVAQMEEATKKKVLPATGRAAKTTFRLSRPEGDAKCMVADGRIELRLQRDFSGMERKRLEVAVEAFLSALDK